MRLRGTRTRSLRAHGRTTEAGHAARQEDGRPLRCWDLSPRPCELPGTAASQAGLSARFNGETKAAGNSGPAQTRSEGFPNSAPLTAHIGSTRGRMPDTVQMPEPQNWFISLSAGQEGAA